MDNTRKKKLTNEQRKIITNFFNKKGIITNASLSTKLSGSLDLSVEPERFLLDIGKGNISGNTLKEFKKFYLNQLKQNAPKKNLNYEKFLQSANKNYTRSEAVKVIGMIDNGTKNGNRTGVDELVKLGKIVRDFQSEIEWNEPVVLGFFDRSKSWHDKVANIPRSGTLSDVINEFKRKRNNIRTNIMKKTTELGKEIERKN